ncbi:hypothetical protein CC86DRAFT_204649 [Ophiobolus disseminans]|uniref:Uncharacterized protein n=1 Tax=Ophiobolus disseminans TaxID=1469910 RepID=A0A6A7A6B6_9PLEO|nr:hypothetical protein CC86DRAFT_204649 [Ophiobolus disseminans]
MARCCEVRRYSGRLPNGYTPRNVGCSHHRATTAIIVYGEDIGNARKYLPESHKHASATSLSVAPFPFGYVPSKSVNYICMRQVPSGYLHHACCRPPGY